MSSIINAPQGSLTSERSTRPANIDYILLDGSGSMHTKWNDTTAAIDAYVSELAQLNTRLIVTQFDHIASEGPRFQCERDCTPAAWTPLYMRIKPLGFATPLYDAINMMGRAMRDLNPERASIVIATDGEETSSRTTLVQAKAILDWCRAKGWQVTFIGCDFNNQHQASLLGGDKTTAIGVSAARLSDATRALAKKRNLHAQFGTSMNWSDDDHQNFGGYLGHSGK